MSSDEELTTVEEQEVIDQKRYTRASLATRALIVIVALMWLPTPLVLVKVLTTATDAETAASEAIEQNETIKRQGAQIKALTEQIAETQQSSQSLLDLITSCTDPDGKCAKQGQAQAAANRGAINAANWLALYCRDQVLADHYTYRELIGCVGRRLDQLSEGGSP